MLKILKELKYCQIYTANPDEESTYVKKLRKIIERSDVKGYVLNDKSIEIEKKDNKSPEWVNAVFNFDVETLRKIRTENENLLNENNPEMYLVQASISYYLRDYIASYRYLKQASKYFYHNQSYVYYFISETNRKYLSKIILNSPKHSDEEHDKLLKQIKNETDGIDLDRTLKSLPNVSDDEFLNDISRFTISYYVFQDLYGENIQLKNEAKTSFIAHMGPFAYIQIENDTVDFFKYELENYLLLDKYLQNINIYRLYIRGKLLSTSSPDKKDELMFDNMMTAHNIHSSNLSRFDLYVILKYVGDSEDIRKLFDDYSIVNIRVDDDGLNYLNIIADNIMKTENKTLSNITYWNLITLCGYINLTQSAVDEILGSMVNGIRYNDFYLNRNVIINFINNARHQNLLTRRITFLKKILDEILNKAITRGYVDYEHLVRVLGFSIKELGNCYSNDSMIKKMMNVQLNKGLINIYPVCSNNIKSRIKKFYQKREFSPIDKNLDTYCGLVIEQIISPINKVEKEVINFIEKKDLTAAHTRYITKYLVGPLITLYINNKILNDKHIKELIDKYASEEDKWLVDPINFDYINFNINWLNDCSLPLLEDLSKKVGKKIKQELISAYNKGNLDKRLTDIYFEYFA